MYKRLNNDDEIELQDMNEEIPSDIPDDENPEFDGSPSKDPTRLDLAFVPTTDDVNIPSFTWRSALLGTIWGIFLGTCNSLLSFRTNAFSIPVFLAVLLSYPMGTFLAVLPAAMVTIGPFTVNLNPGPFSIKEHVLTTIIASSCANVAYGLENVVAQKSTLFMGNNSITFAESLAWVLTTQFLGFGMAGLARRYLVAPIEMVWPNILSTVALFVGFHSSMDDEKREPGMSRFRFFWYAFGCCFIYSWIPQYFFVALQALSPLCLLGFGRFANFLFSADYGHGVGIGTLTFDWYYISGNSLTTPWWAAVNFAFSNIFWAWIITPLFYLWNTFRYDQLLHLVQYPDGTNMPVLNSVSLFNATGDKMDALSLLNPVTFDLKEAEYLQQSPILLSTYFALNYAGSFLAITSAFSHVIIWHSSDFYERFMSAYRKVKVTHDDIHTILMSRYPQIPDSWFLIFLGGLVVLQILVSSFTAFYMPVTSTLLCIAVSIASVLPIGIITAISGQRLGVNVLTEFLIGLISPGKTVEVMAFKSLGTNSVIQAIKMISDLKLGHYMKINPMDMVLAQAYGSFIGAFINVGVTFWAFDLLKDVLGTGQWRATGYTLFYNAGAIWGAIGPARFFGPNSPYHTILWCLLVGALMPVIPWYLNKKFPSKYWKLINVPLLCSFQGPGSIQNFFIIPVVVAYIFQYHIRRNHPSWYERYNYMLAVI